MGLFPRLIFQTIGTRLATHVPAPDDTTRENSRGRGTLRVERLALGACDISKDKGERFVTMVTGALAVWNVGIAFVVGSLAYLLSKRGLLRV